MRTRSRHKLRSVIYRTQQSLPLNFSSSAELIQSRSTRARPDILTEYNQTNTTDFKDLHSLLEYLYFDDPRTMYDGHRVARLLGKTSYWFYKKAKLYDIKLCHIPRRAHKMLFFLGIPKNVRHKLSAREVAKMIQCSRAYAEILQRQFDPNLTKAKLWEILPKYVRHTCPTEFIKEGII